MPTPADERDHIHRRNYHRNRGRWKAPRVYAAADAVYLAVYRHRPKEFIDALLRDLANVIKSRKLD